MLSIAAGAASVARMIADLLPHADLYASVHPLFGAGFAYLRRFTGDVADGRHELDGDRLFALVQSYRTEPAAEKRFEAHRRYIDIQYVFSGEEIFGHAELAALKPGDPFDEAKDIGFYGEPDSWTPVTLLPGSFVVAFPHDGHKPGCSLRGPAAVRKIVIKVAV